MSLHADTTTINKDQSMRTSGVFLSQDELSILSAETQEEIRNLLFGQQTNPRLPSHEPDLPTAEVGENEGPTDLSPAQARKLVAGCSERPTKALKFIAEQPTTQFPYRAVLQVVGRDSSGTMRGTLAAITRRTRTVLGDPDAELIWYTGEGEADWIGSVSPMTHSSLRKAFGL
jgi:hypothetical protein